MQTKIQNLLQSYNGSESFYELLPLLIVATLLCVAAAVISYRLVSLFFVPGDATGLPSGPGGWRGIVYRWLFPDAAQNHQKLIDEIERLRGLVAAGDNDKATQMEHHMRDQRRLVDKQREIEILQGQILEKRADFDAETDKLEALNQHTKHLEKQLEEIMHELARIYHNASERPVSLSPPIEPMTGAPYDPNSATPKKFDEVNVMALPIDPHDPQAEKLKNLLVAYQKRVAERNRSAG